MEVKLETKKHNLYVTVTIAPRRRDVPMVGYNTPKILEWLKENKPQYEIVDTIKAPPKEVHNSSGCGILSGTWIFELKQLDEKITHTPVVPKPKTARPKTTKKKRVYKSSSKASSKKQRTIKTKSTTSEE